MNKFMKVLAASALMATALVGCGKSGTTDAAKYAKVGLGVVSSYSDEGQVNTTMAAIALDAEGKIAYIDLDVAQSTPADEAKAKTQTKKELKEAYGMKETSAKIGKIENGGEWYEQAAAFEEYCKGKTPEEVANMELEEYHGGNAPKTGTDLASKCTITIDAFLEAISEAGENLQ